MLLTMLIWGANIVSVKIVVRTVAPLGFGFLRYLIAGCALLALLRWREGSATIRRGDLPWLAGAGAVGIGLNQVCFLLGIHLVSVSLASIILATAPLLTACMAALWVREPLSPRALSALAVSFGGVVITLGGGGTSLSASWRGGLLILGAAVTMGIGAILAKRPLRAYTSLRATTWMALAGGLTLLPTGLPALLSTPRGAFTAPIVAAMAFTVLGATLAGQLAWNYAIQRIGATRTIAYTYLQPVVGIAIAALLLGERLQPAQYLGGAVVILGLVLYRGGARRAAPLPSE